MTGSLLALQSKITKKDDKYLISIEAGNALAEFLNTYSNQVHKAGGTLAGASGTLAGCQLTPGVFDSAGSKDDTLAVTKYCAGVINSLSTAIVNNVTPTKKTIGDKTIQVNYKTQIQHSLGVHNNKVSVAGQGPTSKVGVIYHDSDSHYADSKNRMMGVKQRLEKEGFTCAPQYPDLYCNGEIATDKLTELAAFFSLLRDGDIEAVSKDKPDVVSEKVWDIVQGLVKKHDGQLYATQQHKPNWSARSPKPGTKIKRYS